MFDPKGRRSAATSGDETFDGEGHDPHVSTFIDVAPGELFVPDYHTHRDPEKNPQRRAELDGYAKKHGGYNASVARPALLNQRKEGGRYNVVDAVGRRYIAMHYPDSVTGEPVKTIRAELLTKHLSEDAERNLFLAIGGSVRPTSQADLFVALAMQGELPEKEQYDVLLATGFQLPGAGARGVPHITLPGLAFGWGGPKTGMTKEERHLPKNANVLRRGLYILKNSTWVKGNAIKVPGKKKLKVVKGSLRNTDIVAVFAFLKAFPDFDEGRLRQILDETSVDALREDARTWLRANGYLLHARYVAYREAVMLTQAYCNGLKKLARLDPDALRFETTAHDVYNAFPKKVTVN